jgi:hypothetical protein
MGAYHKLGIDTLIETPVTYFIGLANSDDARGSNNALEYSKETTNDLVEPTGGSYARQSVVMNAAEAIIGSNGQQIKSSGEIQFVFTSAVVSGTGDGGVANQVTHWFLCKNLNGDSEIISSGLLDNSPITPSNGVQITFPIGSIALGIRTD